MTTAKSQELYDLACDIIPGGVNSPVRAFRSVDGRPRFIRSGFGALMTDVDGNEYIDYVCSWGPLILGHDHEAVRNAVTQSAQRGLSFGAPCESEVRMAQTIVRMTHVDMVRMVNSGTEAVMSAIRLARGFTGRNKIIKFAGCYHGHSDPMLVKAGSGALTGGMPDSAGVTPGTAADTLTAVYNDAANVARLLESNAQQVAAVIVEPVAANMGVVPPQDGFLEEVRSLCTKHGALLIFDEVITGFRLGPGGAQEWYGVRADLVTYGKIIGGGMPVGAFGGRRDIMQCIAPCGPVYQAGTLSGNPVAMAAGLAQLEVLEKDPGIYKRINELGEHLAQGLRSAAAQAGVAVQVNHTGSLCSMFFSSSPVRDYETAKASDTKRFARFFAAMLNRGIYCAPSQFEALFVSAAHTREMIDKTVDAARAALLEVL